MALRGWVLVVGVVVGLAAAAAGCGDDDAGTPDGAVVDDAEVADAPSRDVRPAPAMPAPPQPPGFTPCPVGWRATMFDGLNACDPYPVTGREVCADDQEHFPGEPGCALIGTACPSGDWATDLPVGPRIIYVKRGASPSGAGTQAAPYTTLSGALAVAVAGDVVAIDKQSYSGLYEPAAGVTLWGACVGSSVLSSSTTGDVDGVVTQLAGRLTLRNLTIRANRPGLVVREGAEAMLQSVLIDGARHIGIDVVGGVLEARSLVVRDTVGVGSALDERGRGLRVRAFEPAVGAPVPGRATIRNSVFRHNRSVDVAPIDSDITLEDTALVGTRDEATPCSPLCGSALLLQHATATLRRVFISGPAASAIYAPTRSTLTGTEVIIRSPLRGGVVMTEGNSLSLSRVIIAQSGSTAIAVTGGAGTIDDTVIADGQGGINYVGSAQLHRVRVFRTSGLSCIYGERLDVLEDVALEDCEGQGLVSGAGRPTLSRLSIVRAHGAAMNFGRNSAFDGTDVRIAGTRPLMCSIGPAPTCPDQIGFASGLTIQGGGEATLARFQLTDNLLVGAQIAPFSGLDLSQGEISDHTVGINLQVAGYDITRLADRVIFQRNAINLDSATLFVPPLP